ncbi:hypothetical protein IWQ60_012120 [Tieghemiomyces parasiticus]|uniref:Nucleoside transporter n=1 Tax=Tieghemiomyces parasiticus TaxID=78921 RepID=A0A9W7ZIG5_9FUNG|nr:hypothetical protein IWQ60_012120 [Tieghemiomyces parasiticus]
MGLSPRRLSDGVSLYSSASGYPLPRSSVPGQQAKRPSQHLDPADPFLVAANATRPGPKDHPPRPSGDAGTLSDVEVTEYFTDAEIPWAPTPTRTSLDSLDKFDDLDTTSPPPDRGMLVYFIYLALGVALLLPWNVIINATEFFRARFAGSPYQSNFQNYFSVSYTATNLAALAFSITQQHRIKPRLTLLVTLVANAVIFLLLTIFTRVQGLDGTRFFGVALTLVILSALSSSFQQSAMFALVARFPPLYIQGVLSGQAVAGVIVSVVQLVITASTLKAADRRSQHDFGDELYRAPPAPVYAGADPYAWDPVYHHAPPYRRSLGPDGQADADDEQQVFEMRAFAYFLMASIVTLLVLAGFVFLQRLPFFQYYLPKPGSQTTRAVPFRDNWRLVTATVRSIPSLITAVSLVLFFTISVFPALTAAVQPVTLAPGLLIAIHFVLFNVGDWIGRFFSMFPRLRFLNPKVILAGALSHVAFIPLFLLCNYVYPGVGSPRLIPAAIQSDAAFLIITLLFGISNGYWCSLAMIAGPGAAVDKERAGTIMSFFLVAGMAVGALASFGVTALACNCNSFDIS